jgi:hypothetical protein
VWVPGRLPFRLAAAAEKIPGVARAVAVTGGTAWLTAASSPSGAVIEQAPAGYRIPIDVGAADPAAYAALFRRQPEGLTALVQHPSAGVFASAEVGLRTAGVGDVLTFGSARVPVAGSMSDAAAGFHELFVAPATARSLGLTNPKYLLVLPAPDASPSAVSLALRAIIPAGTKALVIPASQVPFDRDSPNTLPASLEKVAMGEFAARMGSGGALRLDPVWIRAHIETARVPILGTVTCNRAFVPLLRRALEEVQRRGLASSIHAGQYAGCFVPKFVLHDPTQIISHHAWGSAFDINVPENRFGATPHEDPRLVAVFESLGFQWGGRWLLPDGMHFEFMRFPGSPPG